MVVGQLIYSQKSINQLFDAAKKSETSFAITVPKFLTQWGLRKVLLEKMCEEDKAKFGPFINGIKRARILVDEEVGSLNEDVITKFNAQSAKDKLELYAKVKSNGENMNLYVIEKDNFLHDLFFMISSEKETVLIHLKSKIPLSAFEKEIAPMYKNANKI